MYINNCYPSYTAKFTFLLYEMTILSVYLLLRGLITLPHFPALFSAEDLSL